MPAIAVLALLTLSLLHCSAAPTVRLLFPPSVDASGLWWIDLTAPPGSCARIAVGSPSIASSLACVGTLSACSGLPYPDCRAGAFSPVGGILANLADDLLVTEAGQQLQTGAPRPAVLLPLAEAPGLSVVVASNGSLLLSAPYPVSLYAGGRRVVSSSPTSPAVEAGYGALVGALVVTLDGCRQRPECPRAASGVVYAVEIDAVPAIEPPAVLLPLVAHPSQSGVVLLRAPQTEPRLQATPVSSAVHVRDLADNFIAGAALGDGETVELQLDPTCREEYVAYVYLDYGGVQTITARRRILQSPEQSLRQRGCAYRVVDNPALPLPSPAPSPDPCEGMPAPALAGTARAPRLVGRVAMVAAGMGGWLPNLPGRALRWTALLQSSDHSGESRHLLVKGPLFEFHARAGVDYWLRMEAAAVLPGAEETSDAVCTSPVMMLAAQEPYEARVLLPRAYDPATRCLYVNASVDAAIAEVTPLPPWQGLGGVYWACADAGIDTLVLQFPVDGGVLALGPFPLEGGPETVLHLARGPWGGKDYGFTDYDQQQLQAAAAARLTAGVLGWEWDRDGGEEEGEEKEPAETQTASRPRMPESDDLADAEIVMVMHHATATRKGALQFRVPGMLAGRQLQREASARVLYDDVPAGAYLFAPSDGGRVRSVLLPDVRFPAGAFAVSGLTSNGTVRRACASEGWRVRVAVDWPLLDDQPFRSTAYVSSVAMPAPGKFSPELQKLAWGGEWAGLVRGRGGDVVAYELLLPLGPLGRLQAVPLGAVRLEDGEWDVRHFALGVSRLPTCVNSTDGEMALRVPAEIDLAQIKARVTACAGCLESPVVERAVDGSHALRVRGVPFTAELRVVLVVAGQCMYRVNATLAPDPLLYPPPGSVTVRYEPACGAAQHVFALHSSVTGSRFIPLVNPVVWWSGPGLFPSHTSDGSFAVSASSVGPDGLDLLAEFASGPLGVCPQTARVRVPAGDLFAAPSLRLGGQLPVYCPGAADAQAVLQFARYGRVADVHLDLDGRPVPGSWVSRLDAAATLTDLAPGLHTVELRVTSAAYPLLKCAAALQFYVEAKPEYHLQSRATTSLGPEGGTVRLDLAADGGRPAPEIARLRPEMLAEADRRYLSAGGDALVGMPDAHVVQLQVRYPSSYIAHAGQRCAVPLNLTAGRWSPPLSLVAAPPDTYSTSVSERPDGSVDVWLWSRLTNRTSRLLQSFGPTEVFTLAGRLPVRAPELQDGGRVVEVPWRDDGRARRRWPGEEVPFPYPVVVRRRGGPGPDVRVAAVADGQLPPHPAVATGSEVLHLPVGSQRVRYYIGNLDAQTAGAGGGGGGGAGGVETYALQLEWQMGKTEPRWTLEMVPTGLPYWTHVATLDGVQAGKYAASVQSTGKAERSVAGGELALVVLVDAPLSLRCVAQRPPSSPSTADGAIGVYVTGGSGGTALWQWLGPGSPYTVTTARSSLVRGGLAAGAYLLTVTDGGRNATCDVDLLPLASLSSGFGIIGYSFAPSVGCGPEPFFNATLALEGAAPAPIRVLAYINGTAPDVWPPADCEAAGFVSVPTTEGGLAAVLQLQGSGLWFFAACQYGALSLLQPDDSYVLPNTPPNVTGVQFAGLCTADGGAKSNISVLLAGPVDVVGVAGAGGPVSPVWTYWDPGAGQTVVQFAAPDVPALYSYVLTDAAGCAATVVVNVSVTGPTPCGGCDPANRTCDGCDGVPNSGAVYDLCGVCAGNNTCLQRCQVTAATPPSSVQLIVQTCVSAGTPVLGINAPFAPYTVTAVVPPPPTVSAVLQTLWLQGLAVAGPASLSLINTVITGPLLVSGVARVGIASGAVGNITYAGTANSGALPGQDTYALTLQGVAPGTAGGGGNGTSGGAAPVIRTTNAADAQHMTLNLVSWPGQPAGVPPPILQPSGALTVVLVQGGVAALGLQGALADVRAVVFANDGQPTSVVLLAVLNVTGGTRDQQIAAACAVVLQNGGVVRAAAVLNVTVTAAADVCSESGGGTVTPSPSPKPARVGGTSYFFVLGIMMIGSLLVALVVFFASAINL